MTRRSGDRARDLTIAALKGDSKLVAGGSWRKVLALMYGLGYRGNSVGLGVDHAAKECLFFLLDDHLVLLLAGRRPEKVAERAATPQSIRRSEAA